MKDSLNAKRKDSDVSRSAI